MQRPPPIRRTARRTALLGQHKPRRPHLAAGAGPPPWPPPSAVRRGRSRRGHHTAPASGVGASLWSIFVRDPTSPHPLGVRPDPRGGALKRTTAATTIPTTIRTITAGATAVALLLSYRRKQTANGGATAAGRPRRSPRHRHRPFHQLRRAFNRQRPAAGCGRAFIAGLLVPQSWCSTLKPQPACSPDMCDNYSCKQPSPAGDDSRPGGDRAPPSTSSTSTSWFRVDVGLFAS